MRARFWIMIGLGIAASAAILTIVLRPSHGGTICTWPAPDPHGESFWGAQISPGQDLRTNEEWMRAADRLAAELCGGSVTLDEVIAFTVGAAEGLDHDSRGPGPEDTTGFKLRAIGGEDVGSFEIGPPRGGRSPSVRLEIPCRTPAAIAASCGAPDSTLDISIVVDRSGLRLCGAICRAKTDHTPAAHERMLARGDVHVGAVLRVDGSRSITWTSMNERAVLDEVTGERRWRTPMGEVENRGTTLYSLAGLDPVLVLAESL